MITEQAGRSGWREAVRTAAHEAAIHEEEIRRGGSGLAYNYRWEHVRAVVRLAIRLAERTGADREVVEAAAWLHDVAKGESEDHARDGAILARRILAETDYPPEKVDAVAEAIAKHAGWATTEPVEPLEAAVVWDADKLSKLGVTIALHSIATRLKKGEGTTEGLIEPLERKEWQEQLVRSLNTALARAAGRARLEAAQALYQQARDEFDGEDL